MKKLPITLLIISAILAMVLAGLTRWKAVTTLNNDYDEDDYMRAGQEYAALMRSNNWAGFLETNYRPEHPPLAKIILGASFLTDPAHELVLDAPTTAQPNRYLPRDLLRSGRITNAIFGSITAGVLALVNPLAGFILAIHAWSIKYTSELMLEAIPAFFSFLCVLAYLLWKKRRTKKNQTWLIVSAIFLGLTAASKYLYCVVGVAILIDWLLPRVGKEKPGWKTIVLWALIAVITFLLFDPYLWPDPINRLKDSILFHTEYSTTASEVKQAAYPFWQQFVWLSTSPRVWQENAMYFSIDPWIALLALVGLFPTWKHERIYVIWIVVALIFLLFWPTKWPQYLITFSVPFCYSAAEAVKMIVLLPFRKNSSQVKP